MSFEAYYMYSNYSDREAPKVTSDSVILQIEMLLCIDWKDSQFCNEIQSDFDDVK